MLTICFLIRFPLIAIFFFLDQSNIPIIFINKKMKLQYLNIQLRDFDIEPRDFDRKMVLLSHLLFPLSHNSVSFDFE